MEDNLEFYILLNATRDESFLLKIEQFLFTGEKNKLRDPKNYFSDMTYQIFFNTLCYARNAMGKLPSIVDMEFLFSRMYKGDEDKLGSLRDLKNDIYKSSETVDFSLIEQEVEGFIKQVRFAEAFQDSMKDIQNRNFESAIEKMNKATQVNFDTDLGIHIKDWEQVKGLISEVNNTSKIVSTGYNFLDQDRILDGGLRGGEIGCVAAVPGIGKTLFLGNLAANAFIDGKKVLIVSFETSEMRVTTRTLANLLKFNTRDIISGVTTGVYDHIKNAYDSNVMGVDGDIIIKEYPARIISTNDIAAFVMDLKRFQDWEPDLIILDHILIMSPNNKGKSDDSQSYARYKSVTEEMRNLSKALDIPIWTATQIGRSGQSEDGGTKAITTSKDMSESRGIYDTVDFFCTLNQSLQQKKQLKLRLFVDKCRNGEAGGLFNLKVDYDTMNIAEDI